ncbi:hypothetical protein DAPPUDRAFT_113301 [Daphnia pulex]|uniref:Uncharacterized protein n=1 Tax=Daphnia pulex TaxID=6669 RepID=E9HEN3_DAPPU|nr:hypothetical protein DAPPUDRAFT_113301 [Daphnia pulex]|eukprot:EFX69814.1 hypothetical protein DAPPUDRAFT_113301 [Daphnia pulex]
MATAQDAIDAVAAVGNRIDLMEAGHTNITTQLATITQQLANLIGVSPPPPGPGPGIPAPQPSTRRRLDPSTMEKLHGDASTSLLRSWRNRWDDYAALNQMTSYPAAEQMAALRMCLDPSMQQVVKIVFGILPTTVTTPDAVLDLIGNYVRGKRNAKHRDRRTPVIAVEILDGNGLSARSFANVTPDPGAEVSVGGLDFLSAIGLSESDLSSSSFDLVMADKSAPLLSIGQRDVRIRYGEQAATITVVICPEIHGVLLSWLDCIALRILHSDYPLPRLPASVQTVTTPASRSNDVTSDFLETLNIPSSPSAEQKAEIKAAVANHFSDVFDQSTGLRCMSGPEMVIQLQEDAIPYYVNGARPIPFADRPEVKQLLDDYVEQGLIVPLGESCYVIVPFFLRPLDVMRRSRAEAGKQRAGRRAVWFRLSL